MKRFRNVVPACCLVVFATSWWKRLPYFLVTFRSDHPEPGHRLYCLASHADLDRRQRDRWGGRTQVSLRGRGRFRLHESTGGRGGHRARFQRSHFVACARAAVRRSGRPYGSRHVLLEGPRERHGRNQPLVGGWTPSGCGCSSTATRFSLATTISPMRPRRTGWSSAAPRGTRPWSKPSSPTSASEPASSRAGGYRLEPLHRGILERGSIMARSSDEWEV